MYFAETKTNSGARQTKQLDSMYVDASSLVVTLMLCSIFFYLRSKNPTEKEQKTQNATL